MCSPKSEAQTVSGSRAERSCLRASLASLAEAELPGFRLVEHRERESVCICLSLGKENSSQGVLGKPFSKNTSFWGICPTTPTACWVSGKNPAFLINCLPMLYQKSRDWSDLEGLWGLSLYPGKTKLPRQMGQGMFIKNALKLKLKSPYRKIFENFSWPQKVWKLWIKVFITKVVFKISTQKYKRKKFSIFPLLRGNDC